jgi:1-acyl-sn-glycerol-3-phosphate acyltransferase
MFRKKIYEDDIFYSVLKPIVDCCTRHSYRKLEVRGKENIPTDGAVLLAPNHTNTLMDALVMLQAQKKQTVFGARADMFKKPIIAKAMYFFRILPMVRQRDGLRNVLKNHESFETIVEVLEQDVRFCMYPEGRHRAAHSLLPLGKGILRAAVAANNKFGAQKPNYIVPVGIEYGDYFNYRNTCLISYGKAINVTEFIKGLDVENDAQVMEPLRKELTVRMSELISYIKDDENLYKKWSLTRILTSRLNKKNLSGNLADNQAVIAQIERVAEEDPEQMQALLDRTSDFEKKITKAGICIKSFKGKRLLCKTVWKALAAIVGFPYFLFSLIAALPMWVLAWFIRKGLKDKAFGNTVNLGVKLGGTLIWLPLIAIVLFVTTPWFIALGLMVLIIPTYSYFYDYTQFVEGWISDCRLIGRKNLRKEFKEIENTFIELI